VVADFGVLLFPSLFDPGGLLMPAIHPRVKLVREAQIKLSGAISEAIRELTVAESLQVINGVMSDRIGTILKYEIRRERHGDTDKPGGWGS
jgi:hypothetical protein